MDFIQPEAPVEHIVWQGRSALYKAAVVVTCSNGICTIKLVKDGSQTSCSVASLRPSPPTAAEAVSAVDLAEPVDVFEPSTSSWRGMVTMHSAVLPLSPNTTLLLLQPGDLNIYKYSTPVLRRGLVYAPGTGASPWRPRPVDNACRMISRKSVAAGMPWTYAGVRHPPARFGLQTAEAAAAAAATGQPLTYRARTKTKREARGHVSNLISTHQAVAARANDIWAGNNTNFTDAEWQQVKGHLQLTEDEEPKLLPGAPAALATAGQAGVQDGDDQAAPAVGAKRGRLQMPAQDPQPVKRNTMQHQQHLHIAAKAAIGGSAADGAPTLPGGTSVQTQQQEQQGLPRQAPAAADIGSNQPPGTKGAAAGSQGQLAGASGSAGLPPLPAAAHQAGASLARLSLQQQQQALPLPPQQGPATQQLVAGGAGVQGLPAGGHSAGSGGLPVAAAAAAAASDHAGASLAQQQEALPLQQQAATQQAGVGQGAQQLGTGDQGVAAGGSKQAGSSAAVAEPGTGAVQQRQALPLQEEAGMQSACAAEGGQQLVVRGAGVQQAAAGNSQQAGSSAASAQAGAEAVAAVPGAPTAAAAVEVLQPGQVVVLTLMSLDKIPVSLGTYKLRVVRKLGAGGECSVWLVELQQDNASSSSSCAGGGSSGASAAPLPPTSATAAGLASGAGAARGSSSKPSSSASAGAGREQPAATYQRMQQLMALKVPFPYDLISADTQACVGRNQYNAAMRKSVVKECTLFAKCSSCDALVDTYGWGTVQLAVPAAVQQQQPPAVPSAAAAGGSSPAPPTVWELAVVLLEYAQHGSAAHQLRSCPPGTGLSPATTKDYIARVAKALVYLHKYHDTCHRDVKASNCLLFKAPPWRTQVDDLPQNQIYHLKLADLGIAKALPRGQLYTSTLRYTPSYRAPEVKSGHNHDFRVDTWGLGCLVLEFRSSLPPWLHIDLMPGLSPAEKEARRGAEELAREDCPYRKLLTPLELEFAATCLERDITKRPTPSHLLATRSLHRYFYASDR